MLLVVVLFCCAVLLCCWCLLVPVGACWCLLVVPVGACWCLVVVVVVCVGGCVQDFWASPPDPPPPDRPSPGPPKFSLFFFLSPTGNFFLSSLSGGFLVEFWWCLKRRGAQMCTFGLSGCRVTPRRLRGRQGFTRQPENSKRAHMSVPAFQTPSKFHEKTPSERRNNEISGGREKKKREILGSPPFGPPPCGLPFCGPPPFGPPPPSAPTKNKIGQMRSGQIQSTKIGQIRPNKDGQIRFGQIRPRPVSITTKNCTNCNCRTSTVFRHCPTPSTCRSLATGT